MASDDADHGRAEVGEGMKRLAIAIYIELFAIFGSAFYGLIAMLGGACGFFMLIVTAPTRIYARMRASK